MDENNLTAKDFLEVVLKDDHRSYGGTSFLGETLKDFIEDVGLPVDTPIFVVSKALNTCGIVPVAFPAEYKAYCFQKLHTALIAKEHKVAEDDILYAQLVEAIGDIQAFFCNKEAENLLEKHQNEEFVELEDAYSIGVALWKAHCEEYSFLTSDIQEHEQGKD